MGNALQQPIKFAELVVYVSANGHDNWIPLTPDQVPEWVKAPDVMGQLVNGQKCMDCARGPKGSAWYRAERVPGSPEPITPTIN